MWSSVILVVGAVTLAGCQPSGEPAVRVAQVSPGVHNVMIETPHWEKYSDETLHTINLVDQDKAVANGKAAALCKDSYAIEVTERRIVPCDWVCDGHPPYATETTWLVSCKSVSE